MITRRVFLAAPLGLGAAPGAAARTPAPLPFRQIHLDFHTSELIPDVGADFNAREFLKTLQAARVNSINVFAKCHHGYAYYRTEIATPHPHLKLDLLGEMVRVLRPAGIAVNYYYSLVWDVLQWRKHPDWRVRRSDGGEMPWNPPTSWPWLCMNTPYLDHVLAENREILARYPVDGAWFDILKQAPEGCYCRWCQEDRRKLGLTTSADDIFRHNKIVARRVEEKLCQLVWGSNPRAATFYNSRLVIGVRDELEFYSHLEIESLPTGGWGYSHFHQRVRYMRTLGKQVVGMTGRFHKSWGDFGGIKNQAALDYECLNFLANGARVSVGDQLHPRGRLDPVTYQRIGRTYRLVEQLEPWSVGARAVADIGVMSAAATNPDMATQKLPAADQGFTNMLLELHQQFDVLDTQSDFTPYKLVILPDEIRADANLASRLESYLARGGAVIASHESLGRYPSITGVKRLGPCPSQGAFLLLKPEAFPGIDDQPYFLYQHGSAIEALPGTQVLATYGYPYFDRSAEAFSSHKQTPLGRRSDDPLITRRGRVVYIANPFFRSYAADAYGIQKQVVAALIASLMPRPVIEASGLPSTAQLTLLEQRGRYIAHVLHYPLTRRAPDIDIIEEPGLVENVELRLLLPRRPARVYVAPSRAPLAFDYQDGRAVCRLARVAGHAAVCFE